MHSVLSMFNFQRFIYIHCETSRIHNSSHFYADDWPCTFDVLNDLYNCVSSAKKWNKKENSWIICAIGGVYLEYAQGPAPPPCGKPVVNSTSAERSQFTTTCCDPTDRYDDIHSLGVPSIPYSEERRSMYTAWFTVSPYSFDYFGKDQKVRYRPKVFRFDIRVGFLQYGCYQGLFEDGSFQ